MNGMGLSGARRARGQLYWLVGISGLAVHAPASNASPATVGGSCAQRPFITATTGSTGVVQVTSTAVVGDFYENATIIRSSAAPDCVATVHMDGQGKSSAGTLVVSSELVGTDEGPPMPIIVRLDAWNEYYAEFAPFSSIPSPYHFHDSVAVQLDWEGATGFPALPPTTLHSPAYDTIHVTAPTVPASGELAISIHSPLTVSWVVPPLDACMTQRVWLYLFAIVGQGKVGSLSCHWPLSAGQGTVPRQLLRALSAQIRNPGIAPGAISIFAGDATEITTGEASYTLVTTDDDPDGDGVGVAADGPVSTNFNLTR